MKFVLKTILRNFFLYFCVVSSMIILSQHTGFAAIQLNVMPVDGGSSVRFGRVDLPSSTNKEVRIRITSTESSQYQVFQRVSQSFQNQRGESLDLNAIEVATLSASNSSGSLELQAPEPLGFAESLIYTSSNNGLSDSFTLIYQVNPDRIRSGGEYFGQVIYTLRPIGGGSREEVVLNMFLEVADQFDVSANASTGADTVRLSSQGEGRDQGYFKISFDGNRGRDIRLYQEVRQFPVDDLNQELDPRSMQVFVSGGENGEIDLVEPQQLNRRRTLIYSSRAQQDDLWINFELADSDDFVQQAGQFTGRIDYTLESDVMTQSFAVDLDVEILPVFELTAEYPQGDMSFKRVMPNSEPQYKEVTVHVNTNMGKPYSVSQNVSTNLTNEKGEKVDADSFTIKQELVGDASGRVANDTFTAIRDGESILFYSDRDGTPARFRVIYQLKPYRGIKAGDYRTSVMYTLGEI